MLWLGKKTTENNLEKGFMENSVLLNVVFIESYHTSIPQKPKWETQIHHLYVGTVSASCVMVLWNIAHA